MENMELRKSWPYHLLGIIVVLTWGVTFVNSKVLLNHGLMAHEIFTLRFLFAWLCIWLISPRKLWCDNLRDELLMVLLGITGGSLYFVTENIAVKVGYVNNVSFIVCTAPLLTTILALLFLKDIHANRKLIIGSLVATIGVGLVVFNGQFVLKINPLGDFLAFAASLCWAVYSILMRYVSHYSSVFITRKVFFYGLITVLPVYLVRPWNFPFQGFLQPTVWANLLFLGVVASFACFALWSFVIKKIGAISASNYIYLNPVSTVVASALVLHERMTILAFMGAGCILMGVYIVSKALPQRA